RGGGDMKCDRPDCQPSGTIGPDGYCDQCFMAPSKKATTTPTTSGTAAVGGLVPPAATGTTREARSTTVTSRRTLLGAGLVEIPTMPAVDPEDAVLDAPQVPERKRFCVQCGEPVGRSHGDVAGRTEGFCRKCGQPFAFKPKLGAGALVAGQYE